MTTCKCDPEAPRPPPIAAQPSQNVILREIVARLPNAQDEIIQQTILVANRLDLTQKFSPIDVARASGFSDEDLRLMNIFMDPAFNKGKIYLAPDFVRSYLTDASCRSAVIDFYSDVLRAKYALGVDYFELDPQRQEDAAIIQNYERSICREKSLQIDKIKGRPQSVFYAVSGRCFKKLIMQTRTDAGLRIHEYFIRVESLVPIYHQLGQFAVMIIMQQESRLREQAQRLAIEDATRARQLAIEDASRAKEDESRAKEELAHMKRREISLRDLRFPSAEIQPDGFIYVLTSRTLEPNYKYKVGMTLGSVRKRMHGYRTGRSVDDEMKCVFARECYKTELVEKMIKGILTPFLEDPDKKTSEMFVMRLKELLIVINFVIDAPTMACGACNAYVANRDEVIESHQAKGFTESPVFDLDAFERTFARKHPRKNMPTPAIVPMPAPMSAIVARAPESEPLFVPDTTSQAFAVCISAPPATVPEHRAPESIALFVPDVSSHARAISISASFRAQCPTQTADTNDELLRCLKMIVPHIDPSIVGFHPTVLDIAKKMRAILSRNPLWKIRDHTDLRIVMESAAKARKWTLNVCSGCVNCIERYSEPHYLSLRPP